MLHSSGREWVGPNNHMLIKEPKRVKLGTAILFLSISVPNSTVVSIPTSSVPNSNHPDPGVATSAPPPMPRAPAATAAEKARAEAFTGEWLDAGALESEQVHPTHLS